MNVTIQKYLDFGRQRIEKLELSFTISIKEDNQALKLPTIQIPFMLHILATYLFTLYLPPGTPQTTAVILRVFSIL